MSVNVQGSLGLIGKSDNEYHLFTYPPGYRIEDHSQIPEGLLPCKKHHSESFSTPTPPLAFPKTFYFHLMYFTVYE